MPIDAASVQLWSPACGNADSCAAHHLGVVGLLLVGMGAEQAIEEAQGIAEEAAADDLVDRG